MSTRVPNRFDPDEAARTDDELDFVLRSLDDLDAERDAQQISSRRYEELRAAYTAQAADLVRRRQKMTKRRTVAPPRSRRTRTAIAAAAAAALIVPASLAVASSGQRSQGQTITGNTGNTVQAGGAPGQAAPNQPAVDPKKQVADHPQDPQAHDAYAAQLMQNGDYTGALQQFTTATQLDPKDVAALTYSGWIAYLAGFPDQALPRLASAESVDPAYPDAHAFRGIVLLRGKNDKAGANSELRRYLALDPSGPMASQVQAVIDESSHGPGSK